MTDEREGESGISRWLRRHPRVVGTITAISTLTVGGNLAVGRWVWAAFLSIGAINMWRVFFAGRADERARG